MLVQLLGVRRIGSERVECDWIESDRVECEWIESESVACDNMDCVFVFDYDFRLCIV